MKKKKMTKLPKAKIKDFRNHKRKNKAEAVIPTQRELDIVVDQKIMDKISRQRDFIEAVDDRIQIGVEMSEFINQYDSHVKRKEEIKIQWFGMPAPIEIVKCYIRRWRGKYKRMIAHENYLRQALNNDGLTDKEINAMIVENKFYTDRDFLLGAEKKAEEKRLKKQEKVDYLG